MHVDRDQLLLVELQAKGERVDRGVGFPGGDEARPQRRPGEVAGPVKNSPLEDVRIIEPGSAANAELPTAVDAETVQVLQRAIRTCRSVRIDYYTAPSRVWSVDRKIDPYVLAVCRGTWLMSGYCHRDGEVTDFSLRGIRGIHFCNPAAEEASFTRPADFAPEKHFRSRLIVVDGSAAYRVRLLVEPQEAESFEQNTYHASQRIERRFADGRLEVSFTVRELEAFAAFVRARGGGVTALEPAELIDFLVAG